MSKLYTNVTRRPLRIISLLVVLASLQSALSSQAVHADVVLPAVFTDHMVLQRDVTVPVWGSAAPGKRVYVSIGKQKKQTHADANGKWQIQLDAMKAGGPLTLVVSDKDSTVSKHDVLVGEVWICSGQSNMAWSVERSLHPNKEIAAAKWPLIRLLTVPRKSTTEPLYDIDSEWKVCSPESIRQFSAVAYYFGRKLHQELNVPIGLINTSYGGTPAEAWMTRGEIAKNAELRSITEHWDKLTEEYPRAMGVYNTQLAQWRTKANEAEAAGRKAPRRPRAPRGPGHPHQPGGLFNAMVAPLIPYAIRGTIWYQGESNAGRGYEYRKLFSEMITDWRRQWERGDFPFYFVQLANFRAVQEKPTHSDWAELREAQTMALSLPNTGMAVIIDIGEADDIHPKNKQDVGRRLALNALAHDYKQDVVYSGPMHTDTKIEDGKIHLSFDHVGSGLVAKGGERLRQFTVAGEDRRFVQAEAKIDGDKVVVWNDEVEKPVAARYAWADNPICNLYNVEGLPASPFRTDDWPGVTSGATLSGRRRGEWPSWRGPHRNGHSSEIGLKTSWGDDGPPLLWKAGNLGKGHSSVVVSGGKIFTLGQRGDDCFLTALNEWDGSEAWSTRVGGGNPNSTPTVDGDRVYAIGRVGDLVCLETSSGREVWRKSLAEDFGGSMMSGWGFSESPLVDGDRLICTPGASSALLVALDKKSGEVIWKSPASDESSDRGQDGAAYSSVVISNGAGVRQYVQLTGRGVVSVRADDGTPLWSYNRVANATANVPTPIVHKDYVFCSSGYGAGSALLKIVSTKTGIRADEVYFLSGKEMQNHHGGMVLVGDHVYCGHGHNNGFPLCVELRTGKVAWRPGRGPGKGSAAVLYADGHLYFRYENGVVAIIEARPDSYVLKTTFEAESTEGKAWPHPVIAAGRLYLRDQTSLMCYELN